MPTLHTHSLINGQPDACIAGSDRGLHYGDGLFETLAVRNGQCEFWQQHMQRLADGCARLRITAPDVAVLRQEAAQLTHEVAAGVLKIIITRGSGGRGYRVPDPATPTRILQCSAAPAHPADYAQHGVRVRVCTHRLGHNAALAGIKHLNRLDQVLARLEWDGDEFAEGLLLDQQGRVIEGIASNLFLVQDGRLLTPALHDCGVAGVMRGVILELAGAAGLDCTERAVTLDEVFAAEELFLSNSLIGIWPIRELQHWQETPGTLTRSLQQTLERLRQPTQRQR